MFRPYRIRVLFYFDPIYRSLTNPFLILHEKFGNNEKKYFTRIFLGVRVDPEGTVETTLVDPSGYTDLSPTLRVEFRGLSD